MDKPPKRHPRDHPRDLGAEMWVIRQQEAPGDRFVPIWVSGLKEPDGSFQSKALG